MGNSVLDVDPSSYIPLGWSGFFLKAARRVMMPMLVKQYNGSILKLARGFKPEIFLAFKGQFILPETLQEMRAMGISLYNFYPDTWVYASNTPWLPRTLQEYDCVFSTKKFTASDMEKRGTPLRDFFYLAHGYDPELHCPTPVSVVESSIYGSDVTFIGAYSPGKMEILSKLESLSPGLNLTIWGNDWEKAKAPNLQQYIKGRWLPGVEYVKGLCSSKIAIALLLERSYGASSGDRITSRTFNIPATGTFMIHQRTDEVMEYFEEGKEIECFGTPEELAEKIKFYLAHPEERKAIAQAGYRRCVPAYSQDSRMKVILDWHRSHSGR
ncbi:MAG TPA: glycosyltransferase [bacterium]|nr:glycosyltransferase [bacterium]